MRHVRNVRPNRIHLGDGRVENLLHVVLSLAEPTALFLAVLALRRVFGLTDRLADFVRLRVELLDFGLFVLPVGLEREKAVDVSRHAAMSTIEPHGVGVFDDELAIEHGTKQSRFESIRQPESGPADYDNYPKSARRTGHRTVPTAIVRSGIRKNSDATNRSVAARS